MTLGEYRVGISFNPSSNPQVDALKRAAADWIDLASDLQARADESAEEELADKFRKACAAIDMAGIPERERLRVIALDCVEQVASADSLDDALVLIEDAAMWAVKAATKGPRE